MKIETRDLGFLAAGCIIGVLIAVSFITAPTQPSKAPASGIIATGSVFAAASLPPQFITTTNFQWELPPVEIVLPPQFIDRFDSQSALYPPVKRSMDLIDMRYQPDIKLDDLK